MTRKSRPFWNRLTQAMKAQAVKTDAPQRLQPASAVRPLALEQRFMFDGAAAVDVAHAATDAAAAEHAVDAASALRHALTAEAQRTTEASSSSAQRQEVVFVDSQVANLAELLAGLSSNAEVVILDASKDGLQQMADYLKGRENLDAIHLLSHGADGAVQVGKLWLNNANLTEHRTALESIGSTLSADGDLLLYGCSVGESSKGQAFLDALALMTGADVAGSTDDTGGQALGGNWVLELHRGDVETTALFQQAQEPAWNYLLASAAFTSGTSYSEGPDVDAYTSTVDALGQPSRNLFLLNAGGTYTFNGKVDSGNSDSTDVIPIEVPPGYEIASYTFQASGALVGGKFLIEDMSGTNGILRDQNLSNAARNVSGSTAIKAGSYGVYVGNGVNVFDYTLILNVVAINAPPVISNFNGDAVPYVEDAAYVLLDNGSNAIVTDADSVNFAGGKMTVQITTGLASGEDVLFIRNEGNGANLIFVSGASIIYNGLVVGTFTGGTNGNPLMITFTNNANPTTVSALVHNLAYRNSNSTEPSTTPRTVSVAMDDGAGGTSATATIGIEIHPVNDAPVVNITATNPTYTENTSAVQLFTGATINTVESGQSVLQMVFTVSGVANGAAEKLVIDGTDVTLVQGTSLTTSANGISITVSVSSGTATVTLDKAAGLSTATAQTILNNMAYRNDSETPTTVNRVVTLSTVSDNGGNTDGGQPTAAVGIFSTVTVVGVNDAPILANGPYNFATINEDVTATGVRISTILASHTMVDPDSGALRGVAIIGKTGNGTWQYSTDNSNWTDFGAVSNNSSLLLAATTYVRYVPDAANGETATLSFRGWDQTTGTASVNGVRSTADTTSNGGTTAFSLGTGAVNQIVTSVNDAPVMIGVAPTLTGLTDTSTNNAGSLVSSLVGGITDVDSGAVKGIAITGLTGTYGKWQYSTDAGSTWTDVGAVSNATALILNASNKVRYVPDGVHGETATIIYKAWDQTSGAGLEGTKSDTTISGGTSAYSTGTDTASVVVTAVNDAPVVTVSGGAASWSEGNNVASTPVVVDPGLTLSDTDGPNPLNATAKMLTYYSSQDTLIFVNDGATMGNIVGTWTAGNGTLTLTSAGNQATVAQFEAALRSITYNNSSNSPNTTTRTVQFIVTDGSSAASTAVTRDITITAVNNSPTISAPATLPINEDTLTALGQITFSDVDSTLGTVTFSVGSGAFSAIGSGGVSVGGTQTAITLSGTLANINLFIASNKLNYTPAANASGDVTLTINVNTTSVSDATTTVTLQVAAVNDAPVVTVPVSIGVTEDVSSVISGISFSDVDAGANTVVATFSVPSGTLSASSGSGVTVSGADTGVLTLSGSLADINAFISANSLTFKTAQDSTTNVVLTVTLNDKGFSGSGGEQTDTKTVTLNVTAVNDAPVNNVPGAQTASQNIALGFNTANGNAISITDVDAGNGLMTVTLSAVNGTLSLGSLSGITLIIGTGTNNAILMFEGTRSNLNAALQTLSFKSGSNFLGAASVTIETNDNGNSGTGGAKTDVDVISINVLPVNPKVTSVSAQGIDRTVKVGDEVLINMSWDQVVNVDANGGSPSLLLETGLVDREAVYVSGSGSNTLVFKYTVQAGDLSADLDFQSAAALQLNGAVISNNSSDLAVLTLPTVGGADSLGGRSNIVVDGVVPVVGSVQAPTDGTYITGQTLDFTVNFSENVIVDSTGGVPRIAVTLDTGGTVFAQYVSGSGGNALVFRLTVASGQLDSNGVTLGSAVQLNGGSIRDSAGNDTVVTLNSVASTANVNVDGVVPAVVSVTTPADGSYKAGDVLTFTVNGSEALQIGSLPPRLVLDVGGVTRYATYVSGSGGSALMFQYIVQAGDTDTNGIALNSLDLRGEQLTDLAGNDLNLTLNGVGSTAGVVVDTQRPIATIVVSDTALAVGETSTVTITFSEAVTNFNLADLSASNGTLSNLSTSDYITWTATLTPTNGVTHSGNVVTLNNSGVNDLAGNAGAGTTNSNTYSVDTQRPTATIVFANPNIGIGQTSQVTITFSEAVSDFTNDDLTVSNGTLSAVSSSDGGVTWVATFTPTAGINSASNHVILDNTGVTDGAGNAGSGTTTSSNYAIDGVRPTATVAIDKSSLIIGQTAQLTITFSEAVTGFSNSDLTVSGGTLSAVTSSDGGVTWTATFTPAGNITNASNVITLDNTGYTDTVGNAGTGTSVSNNYAIDTQRPTATIAMSVPTLRAGETSQVTITFSEAVTGFTLGDLNAGHGTLSNLSSSDGGITWTAIFTPDANTNSATNVVSLANTGVADIAGNSGAGTTSSANFTIDTVRPTAVIVMSNPALKIGDTSQVTIIFSQAVSGFTNADLTVVGGTLSAVSSADGGITWSATFTPAGNISNAANHITLDNSGVNAASSGNAGTGLTTSNNYVIDTQRPTATIVVADNQLGIGGSSQVTITFSEAVTGFSLADMTTDNGTLSNLTTSDNITWTATLTPVLGVNAGNNRISLANTGVTDIAGNAGSGVTNSNAYAVDSIRPTATIVISDPTLSAGESTTVTITFSEAVTGLDNTDLSVPNGTLGTLSSSDGGITWTATYTPNANVRDTSNVIALSNPGYTDLAGNAGVGVTNSANFTIDTVRPTATIVVSNPTLNVGSTSQVAITFSEAVTGFTNADLTVENGTLSAVSSNDGGVTWSATFTPSVNITDTSNVITLSNSGVENAAGNAGAGTTTSNNYAIDTQRPTATITVANPNLGVGQTTTVTIAFNEVVTGFSLADLSVANGVLSNLASSDGGKTWTATLTPTVAITDPTNLIVLDTGLVADNAGNVGAGIAISNNYAIDTLRPTATIVVTDTALAVGETSTVTITFSEAVNDFTNADLSVSGGTLSAVSSSDGGVTWTATFTPTANVESTVNRITLNNAGVTDKVGNAGVGTTDSNNYAIDTQRPTATIVVTDTTLAVGESSTVTITFSEAVSGLTTADFTVANGTLSNLSSGDGGTTWTATLTPTVGITDTSNLITLDNSGYVDAAGNTGSGTTDSNRYAIDTQRPTATIVVADSALKVGETSLVTITFSEAVTGLNLSDFSVEHGALNNLMSSDGGVTWTATLTPTAGITDTSNVITLSNTGYVDAAGNSGAGTTDSNHYAIDTQRPTATIVVTDSALKIGETTLVTITFSEAVSGLTTADFTVANGTLSNLSSSDGGLTWTAMLTPTAGITDTSNVITLDNSGYVDAAGNAGSGTTDSNSYAIDTQRPTATIVVTDSALKIGETTLVTITFSEVVSGLTTADFTVANGTLSNLSSNDGGITWTAILTPTAGITDTSNVITLDNNGYVDAAGNTGAGSTDSNNYAIDTQRPTATIVVADNALKVGETSLVTITFSEAVNGFSNADLSVANGTLSAVSSSDGGITWTATFTPTAGISQVSSQITLNNSDYVDAAGNSGTGTTASNVYAIDTLDPVAPEITLDQATLVDGRQVSPTGLVIISALEAGGSWQYSLDNGSSWIEGRGNAVQLPALGAFNLWVQQKDAAGNASPVTSLNGIVEPLVPPPVQPPGLPAMNDLPAGPGLAPFQASEVSEPNADFLQSTSTALNTSSQRGGMHGSEHWSGYGVPQSIAGVNDWMGGSLFVPTEVIRSGLDPVPEQFSVSTGASILDLKPVLLASDSPWDIASLRFSFADRQELPGWVRLDRQSGQLTIHAPKDLSTTLVLQIKVSDGKGHESLRTVKVVIGEARATSSAPAGRAGLSEKMANAANQQAGKRMSMYVHG